MADVTFYRQARMDAGVRTGIELGGETAFERFEEGGPESDPALLWYVDLRCKGPGLPDDPAAARSWLLENEEEIRSGFRACAAEVEVGRDLEMYPFLWDHFPNPPRGVDMTIACATSRRVWALSLPKLLEDVGTHWRERIESLEAAEWVA